MKKFFQAVLSAAVTAASLCLPVTSVAGLVVEVTAAPEATAEPYLVQAVRHAVAAAPVVGSASEDEVDWIELPTASPSRAPLTIKLRGQSDLALWNLIAAVHAQQQGKVFDLVEAGSKTVWDIEREQVSAVPLPGALWLFVMGVLGLAGTRIPPQGVALGGLLSAARRRLAQAWAVPGRLQARVG